MHETIAKAHARMRSLLEPEAKELFHDYGLPVQPFRIARSEGEAVEASNALGYPAVLKVVSPGILHKSDVGGVRVRLVDAAEVSRAYREMSAEIRGKAPAAKVEGFLVASYAPEGLECIVGMTRDPQFGPALMFGIGGVFVELLKDVAFRVLPIERRDAQEMVREIRGYPLLEGARGRKPRDVPAIVDFLLGTARLVLENPEIEEIDVNPLIVYEKGAIAVDVRVIL